MPYPVSPCLCVCSNDPSPKYPSESLYYPLCHGFVRSSGKLDVGILSFFWHNKMQLKAVASIWMPDIQVETRLKNLHDWIRTVLLKFRSWFPLPAVEMQAPWPKVMRTWGPTRASLADPQKLPGRTERMAEAARELSALRTWIGHGKLSCFYAACFVPVPASTILKPI